MFEGFSWFQSPGRTPTLSDLDYQPFFRRHFWPPSAVGIIILSVVTSMLIGFVGAVIYTSSDNAKVAAVDPTDQARVAPTVPTGSETAAAAATTTTKAPEILTADGIAKKAAASVWTVASLDDAGSPIEGSGFVAGSFGGQTYLLTSLAVVRAATRIPGPDVVVRNGGSEAKATLWTWQEDRDLALLVIGRNAPSLSWADQNPQARPGDKVYVVSGSGAVVAGVISGLSPAGIQHNVFVDGPRQGAPLLNEKGQVLGMASLSFNPDGAATDTTFTAVPIGATCERVLSCGTGNASVPSTTVAPGAGAGAPGPAGVAGAAGADSSTTVAPTGAQTSTTRR
jgi:S1-C subfamily serine protease